MLMKQFALELPPRFLAYTSHTHTHTYIFVQVILSFLIPLIPLLLHLLFISRRFSCRSYLSMPANNHNNNNKRLFHIYHMQTSMYVYMCLSVYVCLLLSTITIQNSWLVVAKDKVNVSATISNILFVRHVAQLM